MCGVGVGVLGGCLCVWRVFVRGVEGVCLCVARCGLGAVCGRARRLANATQNTIQSHNTTHTTYNTHTHTTHTTHPTLYHQHHRQDVSVVDLTVTLAKPAKYEDLMAALKEASEGERMRGILG